MQHLNDDDRKAVLGEVLMDELKVIRKHLERLLPVPQQIAAIHERLGVLETDVKVIKAAVTDQGRQAHDHEVRIVRLETATP